MLEEDLDKLFLMIFFLFFLVIIKELSSAELFPTSSGYLCLKKHTQKLMEVTSILVKGMLIKCFLLFL